MEEIFVYIIVLLAAIWGVVKLVSTWRKPDECGGHCTNCPMAAENKSNDIQACSKEGQCDEVNSQKTDD